MTEEHSRGSRRPTQLTAQPLMFIHPLIPSHSHSVCRLTAPRLRSCTDVEGIKESKNIKRGPECLAVCGKMNPIWKLDVVSRPQENARGQFKRSLWQGIKKSSETLKTKLHRGLAAPRRAL